MPAEQENNFIFIGVMIAAILLGNYYFSNSKATGISCAPTHNAQGRNAPCPCGIK